jgi:hypothetical protein
VNRLSQSLHRQFVSDSQRQLADHLPGVRRHLEFGGYQNLKLAELVLTFFTGLSMEHNLSSSRSSIVRKIDDLMNIVRTL